LEFIKSLYEFVDNNINKLIKCNICKKILIITYEQTLNIFLLSKIGILNLQGCKSSNISLIKLFSLLNISIL
jgi:hypothetical protein